MRHPSVAVLLAAEVLGMLMHESGCMQHMQSTIMYAIARDIAACGFRLFWPLVLLRRRRVLRRPDALWGRWPAAVLELSHWVDGIDVMPSGLPAVLQHAGARGRMPRLRGSGVACRVTTGLGRGCTQEDVYV